MHVNKTKLVERNISQSIITWPVLGKQNIPAKEVCYGVSLEFNKLFHNNILWLSYNSDNGINWKKRFIWITHVQIALSSLRISLLSGNAINK